MRRLLARLVRGPLFAVVALCAAMLSARPIAAQACTNATCTVTITMPVSDVLRLTLGSTASSLGTPTESDFTAGFRDLTGAATTVAVKANRAWRVTLSSSATKFTYAGSLTNPQKPSSDLRWATTQAGLSTTTNNLGTPASVAGTATPGSTSSVFFRTLWNYAAAVPGTYSLAVSFTLSAP